MILFSDNECNLQEIANSKIIRKRALLPPPFTTLRGCQLSITDNVINFAKDLRTNNLLTGLKHSDVEAKFIGQSDYSQIIERSGIQVRTKEGFKPDAFIQEARNQYEELKKRGGKNKC